MHNAPRNLQDKLYFRCGHAISGLCEARLRASPSLGCSEGERHEWWLVSDDLARQLDRAGEPVLTFYDMHVWGRTPAAGNVADDPGLAHALRRAAN